MWLSIDPLSNPIPTRHDDIQMSSPGALWAPMSTGSAIEGGSLYSPSHPFPICAAISTSRQWARLRIDHRSKVLSQTFSIRAFSMYPEISQISIFPPSFIHECVSISICLFFLCLFCSHWVCLFVRLFASLIIPWCLAKEIDL